MSESIEFTINSEDLVKKFETMHKVCPDYCFDAVQLAGTHLRNDVEKKTEERLTTRTGHLIGGYVRRAKQSGVGESLEFWCEVSGGNKSACHFHLLEHGHVRKAQRVLVLRGPSGNDFYVPKRKMKAWELVDQNPAYVRISAGQTKGYHMMEDTKKEWISDNKFTKECEKAVKKAVKKGFEL